MTATCVNLKQRFGDRFKVAYEESYQADRGEHARAEDPWLMLVLCQGGEIYPHGGELLGVATKGRGSIAKRLASLDCVTVTQDGTDGINATFHVDDFDQVAEVMKPRKRRHGRPMTDEQKQQLADMGRAALRKLRRPTTQSKSEVPESPSAA